MPEHPHSHGFSSYHWPISQQTSAVAVHRGPSLMSSLPTALPLQLGRGQVPSSIITPSLPGVRKAGADFCVSLSLDR